MSRWSGIYRAVGVLAGIVGVIVALSASDSKIEYKPVEGISVFAVLYVIAQGVERLVEWTIDLATLLNQSPGKKKDAGLQALTAANSTLNGSPTLDAFESAATAAADAKKEVETARTDITFLAHGLSILLAAIAVNWLDYGIFTHLGATGISESADHLFSALAAAGGSKGVHELIGRLQKTKEASEEAAAPAASAPADPDPAPAPPG